MDIEKFWEIHSSMQNWLMNFPHSHSILHTIFVSVEHNSIQILRRIFSGLAQNWSLLLWRGRRYCVVQRRLLHGVMWLKKIRNVIMTACLTGAKELNKRLKVYGINLNYYTDFSEKKPEGRKKLKQTWAIEVFCECDWSCTEY